MAEMIEPQTENSETTFPQEWQGMIQDSVVAAHAELDITMDAIRASEAISIDVNSVVVDGEIVKCTIFDFQFGEEITEFKPGTLISIKAQEHKFYFRKGVQNRPRFVRGSVNSITEANGGFIVEMKLQDPMPEEVLEYIADPSKRISIHPRVHKKRNRAEKHKENLAELNSDDLPLPAQRFLTGSFESAESNEPRAESDYLSGAQNEAFGKAMDIDNYPVLFIDGGPGTGKTSVIREIVDAHIQAGRSVLVLSHSNRGKDVPALKLLEKWESEANTVKEARIKAKQKIHIAGNDPTVIDDRLHKMRIRRNMQFPVREFLKIAQWSDEKIIEKYQMWTLDAEANAATSLIVKIDIAKRNLDTSVIKQYREMAMQDIIDRYDAKKSKAQGRLEDEMSKGAVAFSTFGTLLTDEIVKNVPIDVVIVDEATRMRTPELVQALHNAGKQLIFVGDPRQLGNIPLDPAMHSAMEKVIGYYSIYQLQSQYRRRLSDERYSDTSGVIERYEDGPYTAGFGLSDQPEVDLPYVFLDTNRRSLPNIVKVLSGLMYDNKLKPGREASETLGDGIVQWIDTQNLESHEATSGTSKKNPQEATIIVNTILHRLKNGTPPEEIGVIATYREQAELIKKKLRRKLRGSESGNDLCDQMVQHIDSVDSFQGDERKIIYVSLTRSNQEGHIGFLEEQRRIGVAIGRAQEELYIVGDASTVIENNDDQESQEFFGKLHDLIGEHGKHKVLKKQRQRRKRRR